MAKIMIFAAVLALAASGPAMAAQAGDSSAPSNPTNSAPKGGSHSGVFRSPTNIAIALGALAAVGAGVAVATSGHDGHRPTSP